MRSTRKTETTNKVIGRTIFAPFLSIGLLLAPLVSLLPQNPIEIIEQLPGQEVDTNYVEVEKGRLSIRPFLSYKNQSFSLLNNDYSLRYAPNNRFGIGVGAAYYPLILDLALNLKLVKDNASSRTDLQGELIIKNTLFHGHFQNYRGFDISGNRLLENVFREDIQIYNVGISALHILNAERMSLQSVLTGGATQKKSMGSWALGGGIIFNEMKADSSIIPSSQQDYFNEQANLTKTLGFTASFQGGYMGVVVLPHGFFLHGSLIPGVGLAIRKNHSSETYFSSNPLTMELDFQFSVGYNDKNFYSTIGLMNHISTSSLDFGNRLRVDSSRIKWIFGFKL